MKHLKQKLLLTALLLLAVVSVNAQVYFEVNGINYKGYPSDETCVVTSSERSGDLVIPENVLYNGILYSVTEIGTTLGHQSIYPNITSLTIPHTVTSIGNGAFAWCKWLTSVTINNGVKTIGSNAFYHCENLSTINFGNSVEDIGYYAFQGCTSLTSIVIPNSVASIGGQAFKESGLRSIFIPNSVKSIGSSAFDKCSGLTNAEFESIEGLCGIEFGNYSANPLYKTNHLYIDGKEITELEIPNTVTSIGQYAFYKCTAITSITIPNSVEHIGKYAISYAGISSVSLPNSVTTIEPAAFYGCSNLTSINVDESNEYYRSIDGVLFDKQSLSIIQCPSGRSGSYEIPKGVKSIISYAFGYCKGLTSVIIPSSVTTIEIYAFSGCSNLTDVYNYSREPQHIDSNTFAIERNLHVLEGLYETYYNSSWNWEGFNITADLTLPEGVEIIDGDAGFSQNVDKECASISYTRTFNNTNWQALYVPFSMNYEDWAEEFEVARLNNVNQYDDDNDGTVDRTVLEIIKLAEGSKTEANTPYMIKAKETGEKTITVADATLYKTEETSHDVTSWETKFTFTGTYHTVTDMATNGYYALAGGSLQQATSDAVTLSPMRWYLSVTDRNGNPQGLAKSISVVIDGGETTGISEVNTITTRSNAIYSINGSYIGTDRSKLTKGIYVSGGKKIIIK